MQPVLFSSLGRGATVSLENTCIIGSSLALASALSCLSALLITLS